MPTETLFNCDGCGKQLIADWWEAPQGLCTECYLKKYPPDKPRCRCGEVDNLQDGWVAGSIIWYCPVCRADEDER